MYKNKKNNCSGNKLKESEHLRYMIESRTSCQNLNRSHKNVKSRIPLFTDADA